MGIKVAGLYTEIAADTSKLKRGLNESERMTKKTGLNMSKSFNNVTTSVNKLKVAIGLMAGVLVASKISQELQKSIKAASSLQEVTNKFNVVFDTQKAKAEGWAKILVDSYVMSTRESKQFLASIQDLLVPMGMNKTAAGELSFKITKLAADLGSFNDLDTADVMRDIQSALVGEYQTMRKYGVVLSATIVQEKALSMGLAKTKKELTAADKAQAAYKIILESSSAAIGDVARSQGTYAQSMRQLTKNIEDLRVAIGSELMPVIADMVTELNNWYKANKEIINQDIKGFISSVIDVLSSLYNVFTIIHNVTGDYGIIELLIFGKYAPKVLKSKILLTASALLTIGNVLAKTFTNYGDTKTKVEELVSEYNRLIAVKDLLSRQPNISKEQIKALDTEIASLKAQIKARKELDFSLNDFTRKNREAINAINGNKKSLGEVNKALKDTAKSVDKLKISKQHEKKALDENNQSLKDSVYNLKDFDNYVDDASDGLDDFTRLNREAINKLNEFDKSLKDASDKADLAFKDSWVKYEEGIDAAAVRAEEMLGNKTPKNIEVGWDQMTRNIQDIWGNAFEDLFTGEIRNWEDFFDSILDAFLRMLAQMVAQWAASGLMGLFTGKGFGGFTNNSTTLGSIFSSFGNSGGPTVTGELGKAAGATIAEQLATKAGISAGTIQVVGGAAGVVGGGYGVYSGIRDMSKNGVSAGNVVQTGLGAYSMYKGGTALYTAGVNAGYFGGTAATGAAGSYGMGSASASLAAAEASQAGTSGAAAASSGIGATAGAAGVYAAMAMIAAEVVMGIFGKGPGPLGSLLGMGKNPKAEFSQQEYINYWRKNPELLGQKQFSKQYNEDRIVTAYQGVAASWRESAKLMENTIGVDLSNITKNDWSEIVSNMDQNAANMSNGMMEAFISYQQKAKEAERSWSQMSDIQRQKTSIELSSQWNDLQNRFKIFNNDINKTFQNGSLELGARIRDAINQSKVNIGINVNVSGGGIKTNTTTQNQYARDVFENPPRKLTGIEAFENNNNNTGIGLEGHKNGGLIGFKTGGILTGGTGFKDDIYIGRIGGKNYFAQGGEYIINKSSTKKFKSVLDSINNKQELPVQVIKTETPSFNPDIKVYIGNSEVENYVYKIADKVVTKKNRRGIKNREIWR